MALRRQNIRHTNCFTDEDAMGWLKNISRRPMEVILNERCLQLQDYGSNWQFSMRGTWIVPLHAGASDKKDCKASPQTNLKNKNPLLWLCNCAVCVWVYVCEARIRAPKMGEGCAPDAWVCKVSYAVSLTNGVEQKGQEAVCARGWALWPSFNPIWMLLRGDA